MPSGDMQARGNTVGRRVGNTGLATLRGDVVTSARALGWGFHAGCYGEGERRKQGLRDTAW